MDAKALERLNQNIEKLNSNLEKLLNQGQTAGSNQIQSLMGMPMVEMPAEVALNSPEILSMLANAYQNNADIMVHENAKLQVMPNGGVYINDAQGTIHQINTTKSVNPDSSYIQRISFLPETNTLQVKFKRGTVYNYQNNGLTQRDWAELVSHFMQSEDISRDFHPMIKNNSQVSYYKN